MPKFRSWYSTYFYRTHVKFHEPPAANHTPAFFWSFSENRKLNIMPLMIIRGESSPQSKTRLIFSYVWSKPCHFISSPLPIPYQLRSDGTTFNPSILNMSTQGSPLSLLRKFLISRLTMTSLLMTPTQLPPGKTPFVTAFHLDDALLNNLT